MGTTPTYSWPYPESTDPVANGAQDIEDLALAVETTVSTLGGGKILQIISTDKTDTFTTSSATFVDVTGFSASITPSSATNKVLVIASYSLSNSTNSTASGALAQLLRDSTSIYVGDSAGNRIPSSGYHGNEALYRMVTHITNTFLDSPASTSALTYKLQIRRGSGGTAVLNRSGEDFDGNAVARLASSLILIEVES